MIGAECVEEERRALPEPRHRQPGGLLDRAGTAGRWLADHSLPHEPPAEAVANLKKISARFKIFLRFASLSQHFPV